MTSMKENALDLWERGFNLVQLGKCSKSAIRKWADLRENPATDDTIDEWWSEQPDGNIGLLTGNGLVVVDCDSPEAVAIVESRLPKTPWRVKTRRGCHFYYRGNYRCSKIEHHSIDIKGAGGYVVAPPSIHETGFVYEWMRDGGTEEWEVGDLPELMKSDLAALNARTMRAMPDNVFQFDPNAVRSSYEEKPVEKGERNSACTSLVGKWVAAGYDRKTVQLKAKEWNAKNPLPLPTLEVMKVVDSVIKTHQRNHEAGVPVGEPRKVSENPFRARVKTKMELELDAMEESQQRLSKLRMPGVLGDVFDYYMKTAPQPNDLLAAQATIAFGSVVLGRRYVTTQGNYTSLYLLSIAKSTTGKEHGRKVIHNILEEAERTELLSGSGYTSPGAVFSELKEKPTHICVIDEFGRYLEATKAHGNSALKEATTLLVETFGLLDGTLRPKAYSSMSNQTREDIRIVRPAVTLLGLTTPKQFYGAIAAQDIEAGFLGRLLIIESKAERTKRQKVRYGTKAPGTVIAWTRKARGTGGLIENDFELPPEPIMIDFDEEAERLFDEFEDKIISKQNRMDEEGLDVLFGRTVEIAMRLSAIVAASLNLERPVINRTAAQWAIDYVFDATIKMVEAVRVNVNDSNYGKLRARVLELIESRGERGITEAELNRALRSIEPRYRREALSDVSETGEAELVEIAHKGGKGRPRIAWIATGGATVTAEG